MLFPTFIRYAFAPLNLAAVYKKSEEDVFLTSSGISSDILIINLFDPSIDFPNLPNLPTQGIPIRLACDTTIKCYVPNFLFYAPHASNHLPPQKDLEFFEFF